ncbi:MAG: TIGR00730 family Rossman fold protein [Rhodothermales bacterium]|nr:TIGR00730 family Rossman fold protein [Rhodothermales bacterium]
MPRLHRLCVYCGSSPGRRRVYAHAATALGQRFAARGIGLVFGGGSIGMMRVISDAVLAGGGEAIGVIPHGLVEREVAHPDLTDLRVVDTMHERKALMAELSDGFVALPGGLGTLEELFEVWTWAQLGIHRKPVGLLNAAGYFDALLRFLDHGVAEGFVRQTHRALLLSDGDPDRLLDRMAAYEPPDVPEWLSLRES